MKTARTTAQTPIPAPSSLHPIFPTRRVHLRQPFQLTSPFTVTNQGGEFFHVGEGLANSMEPTMEAGMFDFRFRRPLEPALVVIALEFELSDEHQNSRIE